MSQPDHKRAAAYIRVSTEDQIEYSPDAQLVEIKKYAVTHRYTLPEEFIFLDEGISGKHTRTRPEFNRMIGMAKGKPRPFDAILLWKFSRFARNREDSIVYKSMLRRELGIEVISISEPLTDDKMSIIMEAIIEAMDEYYSINLAEEVKRGMTEKARRGGLQATPAFGYRVEGNVLVPVPEEAELVKSLFDQFQSGRSLFSLVRWLNDLGVVTHRGNRFENRTVEYILRNPVYVGSLRWNPCGHTGRDFFNENIILAQGRHSPLVSQTTWEAVQRRLDERKAQRSYHSRPQNEQRDWVSGLVRCAACGRTLVFTKPHYWRCNGYVHGSCSATQHIADEILKDLICERLSIDMGENPPTQALPLPKPNPRDEMGLLVDQQRQLSKKLSRLREAYLSGAEELEEYMSMKAMLEMQSSTIKSKIKQLSAPLEQDAQGVSSPYVQASPHCVDLLRAPDISVAQKKELAHSIIEKCIFSKEEGTLQIFYRLTDLGL